MQELTGFQVDLLTVIVTNGEPESGQSVMEELETNDEFPHDNLNHGRLYPNLDTLVEKGLVEKSEIDRRTNGYSATARGRKEIADRYNVLEAAINQGGSEAAV